MLIEELCEREDSFSAKDKKKTDDKQAIRKKAAERMPSKKTQTDLLEAAPKRAEEAGVMRLDS